MMIWPWQFFKIALSSVKVYMEQYLISVIYKYGQYDLAWHIDGCQIDQSKTRKWRNLLSCFLNFFTRTTDKIFETYSSFRMKQRTAGNLQFLLSKNLLLVLTKKFFWKENWTLSYNVKLWDFPDISAFSKILSLKSFGNSWGNLYIPC